MFLENNEAFSSKSLGTDFKAVLNESFTSKGMIADWALQLIKETEIHIPTSC